jgi:hypothetical protein
LARRSNNFTLEDYNQALEVLKRIQERKENGIIYRRGGAGKETVPMHTRLGGGLDYDSLNPRHLDKYEAAVANLMGESYSTGDQTTINELKESDMYKLDFIDDVELHIVKKLAPTNKRFTMVAYSDASFAVGELKQSISGFIVFVNGIPLLVVGFIKTNCGC